MITWVLASENQGKLAELNRLLADRNIQVRSMGEFNLTGAEENGLSFVENALIKARHVAKETGLPALADDSGLAVNALGGAPGIYSARYAGIHGNDQANYEKLLADLESFDDRSAQFVCVLALVHSADDPLPVVAQGLWPGEILPAPRGENGFGYDPVFQPKGETISAAELSPQQKSQVSHRALACAELLRQL